MTNKRSYLRGASVLAVLSLGLSAPAMAQTQSNADKTTDIEEVVVTGSYIAGTPEDAPCRSMC
jgi:iron complex outermembrane receptor protein